jgi:hypothetical protein
MKSWLSFIVTLCCLFTVKNSDGQGKIVYLSGKEKRFHAAELKGDFVVYKTDSISRPHRADRYNVFSIQHDNGNEELIYNPDTLVTDDPAISEVREYILGEQFAAKVYRSPAHTAGGIASGMAGSLVGFYGLPAPLVYATVISRFNPKLPKNERTANHSDAFIAGYQKRARNVKIKNSLIGGGIGFAVGVAALVILFGNED